MTEDDQTPEEVDTLSQTRVVPPEEMQAAALELFFQLFEASVEWAAEELRQSGHAMAAKILEDRLDELEAIPFKLPEEAQFAVDMWSEPATVTVGGSPANEQRSPGQ